MRHIDLSNQRFGRLVAVHRSGTGSSRSALWLCRCDCGAQRIVPAKSLRSGEAQSCGCLRKERAAAATRRVKTTHGETAGANSRTYRIWTNMVSRCTNPNFDSYRWYGGRGIKVCDRWRKFSNFLSDMGRAPEGLTIDRVNVNGDYEPGNCRWATWKEQAANRQKKYAETGEILEAA